MSILPCCNAALLKCGEQHLFNDAVAGGGFAAVNCQKEAPRKASPKVNLASSQIRRVTGSRGFGISCQMDANKPTCLTSFDIARAIAAGLVVLSHARDLVLNDYSSAQGGLMTKLFYFVTGLGHQAVMVFFVISGYWITRSTVRRSRTNRWTWVGYGTDRLSRLWVVLLPALLIGGCLDAIGRYGLGESIYLGHQGAHSVQSDIGNNLTIRIFVGNVFFLQTLLTTTFGSNGPLWSLANEFWYYIWFPSFYKISFRNRLSWIAPVIALVTMFLFYNLLAGFICWLFGSVLYFALESGIERSAFKLPRSRWLLHSAIVFACLAALLISRTNVLPTQISDIGIAATMALLFWVLLVCDIVPSRHLAPVAAYGATSSYSLYLCHYPLLIFIAGIYSRSHRFELSTFSMTFTAAIVVISIVYGRWFSKLTEMRTEAIRIKLHRLLRGL